MKRALLILTAVVLSAIFNQCKSLSLTECFPVIAAGNLSTMRIPADGLYENAYVNKQYVLLADMDANRQLLYDMLQGK